MFRYEQFLTHHDAHRVQIPKIRRCFNYGRQYYQLDEYVQPLPPHSPSRQQLIILETYTTRQGDDIQLPTEFVTVDREITGDAEYR